MPAVAEKVEARDYVFEAAKMRKQALAVQGAFKALAKKAKELARTLDEHEEKGVREGQQLMFDDMDEAHQVDQERFLDCLQYQAAICKKVETLRHPEDLRAIMAAVNDGLKEIGVQA